MPSELNVNKISPASGTSVTLGDSGDTFTVPSGVTLSGSGASLTSLPAANLTGTLPAISGANLTNLPSSSLRTGISAYLTANQSIANNTNTKIGFNGELYDPNGDFNTSTNKFTAPEAGKYLIITQVRFNSGTYGYTGTTRIYINGSHTVSGVSTSTNGGGINVPLSKILELASSDYIEIYAEHNQGTSIYIEADGNSGRHNYLTIQRVA
jgi:flagellar basal body rod protein FlgF